MMKNEKSPKKKKLSSKNLLYYITRVHISRSIFFEHTCNREIEVRCDSLLDFWNECTTVPEEESNRSAKPNRRIYVKGECSAQCN